MRGPRRRALWLGLCAGLHLVVAAPAHAAPLRACGIDRKGGHLAVSVGAQDLFGPADGERLRSGFTSRVNIRAEVYQVGQPAPVAQTWRRAEIVYDLWTERFRVTVENRQSPRQVQEVGTAAQAIALATTLVKVVVADLKQLQPGQRYRLDFRADLNPITREYVDEVRRWLAQPLGRGRSAAGDGFFGWFVGIFVHPTIDDSERRLRFSSAVFTEPAQ